MPTKLHPNAIGQRKITEKITKGLDTNKQAEDHDRHRGQFISLHGSIHVQYNARPHRSPHPMSRIPRPISRRSKGMCNYNRYNNRRGNPDIDGDAGHERNPLGLVRAIP